jgi:branched-chain amino acid aminotransferase
MAPIAITPPETPESMTPSDDLTRAALEKKLQDVNALSKDHGNSSPLKELDASKLIYNFTKNPRSVPNEDIANSGTETICTDHMLYATWNSTTGWAAPEIRPYGPFTLMPTASVLHYGTECFDGLKAYRGHDGHLRLFRPHLNCERLVNSAVRITLPGFDPEALEKLLLALVAVDGAKWLPPDRPGSYLYLRPALIATTAQLGVQVPREALLFATASFLPRLDAKPGGQRLHTSPEDTVRAWVGGFGHAKIGANYAPSFPAMREAQRRGFGQVLWLYGPEGWCTEAGTSNFFVILRNMNTGRLELVTAPLDDRIILAGVNRQSVLDLARERFADEMDVVERRFSIDELVEADRDGRLIESFVSGTAVGAPLFRLYFLENTMLTVLTLVLHHTCFAHPPPRKGSQCIHGQR